MSTEIAQKQSFEDRVYEKIRTDIGSLMTDEELKKLVEKSIDRMFFTDRVIKSRDSWGRDEVKQPMIYEAVREAVAAKIDEHVKAYVQARGGEFTKVLEDALAKGFWTLVQKHFDGMIAIPMIGLQQQIAQLLTGRQP